MVVLNFQGDMVRCRKEKYRTCHELQDELGSADLRS
jgi:hypothetical protein